MQQVCLHCHTQNYVGAFYQKYDDIVVKILKDLMLLKKSSPTFSLVRNTNGLKKRRKNGTIALEKGRDSSKTQSLIWRVVRRRPTDNNGYVNKCP